MKILPGQKVSFFHSQGPEIYAEAKTVTMFGISVTYVAPIPRNCTTMPVGVISGYAPKRQAVRNSWGKDVCLYFIVGKNDSLWPEEEATSHGDLLLLDMEEVYHGGSVAYCRTRSRFGSISPMSNFPRQCIS